jgi:polysaccharide export outer membrane protein
MDTSRQLIGARSLALLAALLCAVSGLAVSGLAFGQSMQEVLGPGDTVRITAFRYPDLTTEARISEEGKVNVPMIGPVTIQGLTPEKAAAHIADRLKKGNYLVNPQIDVAVVEARSRQVSVLGFVTRPGRYMLEGSTARVTDVLAMAGGLVPAAADTAVIKRTRGNKTESLNVDLAALIQGGDATKDVELSSGDSIFVPKAPVVYVYGEVMRGGSYRLEPGMTVMQAITMAGGITPRGSDSRVRLRHKDADGKWQEKNVKPVDTVQADDVIFVRESLF